MSRIGRRGLFLTFLTLLNAIFGSSLWIYPYPQPWPYFSQHTAAAAWMVMAVITATGIPLRRDRFQYALAAMFKFAWALRYAWLWAHGFPGAWGALAVWLAFAAIVMMISGWPEPDGVTVIAPPPPKIDPEP